MDFARQRQQMVRKQLVSRGIWDQAVLDAFEAVPRHLFVGEAYQDMAYADTPLPIPAGQTISQPYVVAYMLQALRLHPTDRVLEIGTGSGYAAALLGHMVQQVYTLERHAELVTYARHSLAQLGCGNVQVCQGDGTLGWPEHAPYQAIVVAASGPSVPEPLRQQLAIDGRLVMPIGRPHGRQHLICLTRRSETSYDDDDLGEVRFVPLIGQEGW